MSWVDGVVGWSSLVGEVLLSLAISIVAGGVIFAFFLSDCLRLAMMREIQGIRIRWEGIVAN